MPKKLPYFKFDAESWLSGKIQLLPVRDIGIFINLAARIWQGFGTVKNNKVLHRMVGATAEEFSSALENFLDYELVYFSGEYIKIKFIDEQLAAYDKFISDCRDAGVKSAKIRSANSSKGLTYLEPTLNLPATNNRIEDKRIEDKIKENICYADTKEKQQRNTDTKKSAKAKPSSAKEVIEYCESRKNGIDGQFFWDKMEARGWVFKDGRPVKDWKACVRTWERYNQDNQPKTNNEFDRNTRATFPGDEERGKEFTNGF